MLFNISSCTVRDFPETLFMLFLNVGNGCRRALFCSFHVSKTLQNLLLEMKESQRLNIFKSLLRFAFS